MGSFAVALQASRVNNNIFRRVLHIVTAGAIFFVWDNMKGFIPNYFARVDFFCLVFVCFCFASFLSLECLLTFKAYFCLIFIVLAIIDIGYGYSNQSELSIILLSSITGENCIVFIFLLIYLCL